MLMLIAFLKLLLLILEVLAAAILLFPYVARAIESIYQLSQTPNLNTIQKCWQIVKNFFTIEKYKKA